MTVSFQVDERGFIEIVAEGKNDPEAYISCFKDIKGDDACRGIELYLFNSLKIELSMTGQQMELLGRRMSRAATAARTAVLVGTQAHFGVTRMYGAYAEHDDLQIFRDRDEAIDWLLQGSQI